MNPLGMATKFGKEGLLATFLAGSLLFGGSALAQDVGVEAARKITFPKSSTAFEANKNIKNLADTVAGLTDAGSPFIDRVSTQLQRTAIHESGEMKFTFPLGKNPGPDRGIFQVQPNTAFDVLDRVSKRDSVLASALEKSSGKSIKDLRGMWYWEMDAMLRENHLFAGVMARGVYNKKGKMIPPDVFPSELSNADDFWMENYNRSKKSLRAGKQSKFLKDNVAFQAKLNPVLDAGVKKIGHNAGNASTKSAAMVKKTLKRVITKR